MKEIVRVLRIEGKTITVKGEDFSGCCGCVNEDCRTNSRIFEAQNRKSLEVAEGALVEVSSDTVGAAIQAAIVFGIPILSFILFYVFAFWLWPFAGEGPHAALGLMGLALTSAGVYWFRRWKPSMTIPEILRVVSEEELEANQALGGAVADSPNPENPQEQ